MTMQVKSQVQPMAANIRKFAEYLAETVVRTHFGCGEYRPAIGHNNDVSLEFVQWSEKVGETAIISVTIDGVLFTITTTIGKPHGT